MNDSKPQNDPSMDDILASIRKIISDDEARAAAAPGANEPLLRPFSAPAGPKAEPDSDDVLLLTELVEEPPEAPGAGERPKPVSAPHAGITPIPSPPKSSVMGINEPQPAGAHPLPPQPPATPMPPVMASLATSPLGAAAAPSPVGNVAGKASTSFDKFSRAVVDSEPEPPIPPAPSGGGKTVEDLVREMLRPVLFEWMDKNLPDMVEKLVEREIQRMARR